MVRGDGARDDMLDARTARTVLEDDKRRSGTDGERVGVGVADRDKEFPV